MLHHQRAAYGHNYTYFYFNLYLCSRSTQQSTYNQTSPSTIRSVNNQQSFIQSPSSNQKQYSQSQASGGNFSQVSAANQSQAKSQYNNQSGVGDNLVNVSRSGSGNSTYNNSSAGNTINQYHIFILLQTSVADPDPHFFESKDPDPQKNAYPDPGV